MGSKVSCPALPPCEIVGFNFWAQEPAGVEAVLSLVKCSMTRPGSLCASIAKMALAAADGSCALG